ncbi:hypothetical protein ACJD0Z_17900 [Flavobacteriaceae bacterium M23B6Z8]
MANKIKWLLIPLCFLILSSCESDDDNQCLSTEPLMQFFIIEFTDAEGNNLIDNNVYDRSEIQVKVNGNVIGGVPETVEPTNYVILQLFLAIDEVPLEIILNATETDELILDISGGERQECGFVPLTVTKAVYNDVEQSLAVQDETDRIQKIVIIKQ